jgi:hypothetical protein
MTCHVFWLSAYKQQPNFFVFTGLKKSLSSPFLLYDAGGGTPEGFSCHHCDAGLSEWKAI